MKTLIGFALGTLLFVGTITSASAAGGNVAAPAQPVAAIEVIVVTAKRPAPIQPVAFDAVQPIVEFVVTAKRPVRATDRIPPAMAIEMPKVELSVTQPSVIRL